jgi:L-fucose mutarotase
MTMLKTIPATLSPDLLWTMAAMGHGDRLVIVDANYPAYSRHRRIIPLIGVPLTTAIADILRLMPVDDFIDMPAFRMVPDGELEHVANVHREVQQLLNAAERRPVGMQQWNARHSTTWPEPLSRLSRPPTIVRTAASLSPRGSFDQP